MFTFLKRKAKKSIRHIDGVFFDKRRRVVAIKKKTVTLEMKRSSLRFLWLCVISGAALISVGFFVFGSAFRTHAETLLYPQTCLGGWNHSEKAAGIPEVMGHVPEEYTDDNSASIFNTVAQIFCGGFSGDIPAHTSPTKIIVQFSWAVKALVQPASPIIISSDNYASSTIKIIDVPTDVPAQLEIPVSADQSSSSTPTVPDAPPPAPTPDTSPLPVLETPQSLDTPSPEPVSFLQWLVQPRTVFAQEMATTTPDSSATSTQPASTGDALLEVLYTLDGTTWQSLGVRTQEELSNATFEIPLTSVSNWNDLSQLQVSVRSLSNVNTAITLYLDGMLLSVAYQDHSQEVKDKEVQARSDAESAYRDSLPTRNLTITVGSSTSPALTLSETADGNGKQALIVKAPSGPLVIYNDSDPTYRFIYGIGEDPVSIEAYNFLPGSYTLISTMDPDACGTMTKEQCMNEPSFVASGGFSITDLDATAVSVPAPSSDATVSQ